MKDTDDYFLIVVEQIDDTQRNLIQQAVKTAAKAWWHELLNVWIVQGGTADEWRLLLKVFVTIGGSSIFVFQLPPEGARPWTAYGRKSQWVWLMENYATTSGRRVKPLDLK